LVVAPVKGLLRDQVLLSLLPLPLEDY
jgi:hypothetical protein